MARLARLSIPGEVHHLLLRGHNRQAVFLVDEDRQAFLQALRDAASEHGVAIHAYALLDTEVRLLVTPATGDSLSKAVQALGRRYVPAFNRRHQRTGTLWEGRFRGTVIEGERYFLTAMCAIEASPVPAGLASDARSWPWSSADHHLGGRRDPLVTDHPLYWALGNTPFDREARYRQQLEQGVGMEQLAALMEASSRGWPLGSTAFLARLADLTERPLAPRPRGRPRKSTDLSPIKD